MVGSVLLTQPVCRASEAIGAAEHQSSSGRGSRGIRMRRITKTVVLAATLLAATALVATAAMSASAATVDANGVVTVTKGDIQSKMGWNNAAWDANTDTPAEIDALAKKITANVGSGDGTEPVAVPGG